MSDSKEKIHPNKKLVTAYNQMMARIKTALEDTEQQAGPVLHKALDKAKAIAVELGELTREEAENVASYIQRDIHDAAEHLLETGQELGQWLRFDIHLIEQRLFEMFASVADQTRIELTSLAERAKAAHHYHTGEITGPGTLACLSCQQIIHFHATGHIPPCPKCHATIFCRQGQKAPKSNH